MALAGSAALALATPARAQEAPAEPPPARDLAAMSDEELQRAFTEVPNFSDACQLKVPIYVELRSRHPESLQFEIGLAGMQAYCAGNEHRYADGVAALKAVDKYGPIPVLDNLALSLAAAVPDGQEALVRFSRLVVSGDAIHISGEALGWALRAMYQAKLEKEANAQVYQVFVDPRFATMDESTKPSIAWPALRHMADNGTLEKAPDALALFRSPEAFLSLMADRNFEVLWPEIERRAGSHLANIVDPYVAYTEERLANRPADRDRATEYAYALLYAGRYQEAALFAQGGLGQGKLQERDGWALNIAVDALDALGRHGEADKVFDRLAVLDPAENPWVVNFVINRASRLLSLERYEEALAAAALARPVAENYGSGYARMLVASYYVCALHKLNRAADAATDLAFVREHYSDGPAPGLSALFCAEHRDEAKRRLGEFLDDEAQRDSLVMYLRGDEFDLLDSSTRKEKGEDDESLADIVWGDPVLAAKAGKFARRLPERFIPLAYYRRKNLPVPAD